MSDGDLRVVSLHEVQEEAVLELLRICLGTPVVRRDVSFWRWKHQVNPFGPSVGLVALADGAPVAVRVFLRWQWRWEERTLDTVRAVDTATHPAWRRRGLFSRLTTELVEQCRRQGTAFVFNTPNPASRAGYLSLGWRDVGRVPLMVRILRPGRSLWRLLTLGATGGEERPVTVEPPGQPLAELLAMPALGPFLDAWTATADGLRTPRSSDYLRWRYADVPGLSYRALWSLGDDGSGALLVTRLRRRRGLLELSLSEVLVSQDDGGWRRARELLGRITGPAGADFAAALAARGTAERRLLTDAGFVPFPFGPRLTVLPMTSSPPDPCSPKTWRPAVGDLELF